MKRPGAILLLAFATLSVLAEGDALSSLNARDLTPLAERDVCVSTNGFVTLYGFDGIDGYTFPIVYEDDGRAAAASGYLASVLEEMTGAEVVRYRLPEGVSNRFTRCILIPKPDDNAAERFWVWADNSGVRFTGRSDFGVYDFCERVLGVRHYWDGSGGCSVPKRKTIGFPPFAYSDAPVFSFRQYSSRGNPTWFRVAKGGGTFDRWTRCHTTDDGFCYGSPEGFAEYCRRVDEDIAGGERFVRVVDHARKTVSVSPWDVAYDCKCMWCRTLKGHLCKKQGEASTAIWERFLPQFVKYMAERHPDYRVSILPYWNYVEAPVNPIDIGTNVQAEVCSMSGLAAFKWDQIREREEGIILDWERITGRRIVNWHYSCWPAEYTPAPYVYGHTIAEHYRRMRDHTVGSFICGGKDDFPRFSLSMYVWMRCLWNPEVDVDAVYDEFCVRQFGKAAKPMREVVRIQEEDWKPETLMFPRESLLRLSELLTESAELVRGTSAFPAFLYYNRGFSGVFDLQ